MRQQDFINVMLGAVLEVFGQALIFEGTNARTTAYPAPQRNRAAEHWLIGCLKAEKCSGSAGNADVSGLFVHRVRVVGYALGYAVQGSF